LDVVPTARLDAPELRLAARVLIPVELQTTPFRRLLRRQRFAAGDERRADLAARDHLEQPVDAPLRHVAARPGVDQAPRRIRPEARRQRLRRIARTSEWRSKPPARV